MTAPLSVLVVEADGPPLPPTDYGFGVQSFGLSAFGQGVTAPANPRTFVVDGDSDRTLLVGADDRVLVIGG